MTFDVILNAAWLLVGLSALAIIQTRVQKGKSRTLCCIGVGLIVTTLFPVISATDDLIRIQHLERIHQAQHQNSGTSSHKSANDTLIRLFEAMDSPVISKPVEITFTTFFAFLFIPSSQAFARRRTIAQSGRSPPVCFV